MNRWRDIVDWIFIVALTGGTVFMLACLIAGCRADAQLK